MSSRQYFDLLKPITPPLFKVNGVNFFLLHYFCAICLSDLQANKKSAYKYKRLFCWAKHAVIYSYLYLDRWFYYHLYYYLELYHRHPPRRYHHPDYYPCHRFYYYPRMLPVAMWGPAQAGAGMWVQMGVGCSWVVSAKLR